MILPSRIRGESAYSDDYGVLFFSQARLISARLDVAKPCEVAAANGKESAILEHSGQKEIIMD